MDLSLLGRLPILSFFIPEPAIQARNWTSEQMVDFSSQPCQAVQILEKLYQFRNHGCVTGFLREFSFLAGLLVETHAMIQQHFGTSSEIALEVVEDPETEERQLFALIKTFLPPDEAIEALDRLDQEWWLDALPGAHGKLSIDVEYL
jgi:hypothetical protein